MSDQTNGAAAGGRATDGRFAPGNKGGPGNPFARRTAALRRAAAESASERDVTEVMAALKARALAGDVAAARLWLAYAAGRPGPAPDPDTLDAHELGVRRRGVATPRDVTAAFGSVPASVLCDLAGAAAPLVHEHLRNALAQRLGRQGGPGADGPPEVPTKPPGERPASAPDAPGCDRQGPAYAAMLRRMREGLPGGVKEGDDRRPVQPPDAGRGHRPGRAKGGAGRNGPPAS